LGAAAAFSIGGTFGRTFFFPICRVKTRTRFEV
jgi:hypothetical protein